VIFPGDGANASICSIPLEEASELDKHKKKQKGKECKAWLQHSSSE
jgi:hypothetical protein